MSGLPTPAPAISSLPPRVLRFLARSGRARKGAVLEVGPLRPTALADWAAMGYQPLALTDFAPSTPAPSGQVHMGDVAGGMPIPAHSVECVVVRSARTFDRGLETPESLLGTANLLSCLKAKGSMLVVGHLGDAFESWQTLIAGLPVTASEVTYRDGLGWWLSLQFLKGSPKVELSALRIEVGPEQISRLQWHRLVRDLILKRANHRAAA